MTVDIYIREREGNREIRIPWLPEEIEAKSGGTVRATYDIMDKGPVEKPTGSGLWSYSWEGIFPGKNRTDKSMLRGQWKSPESYHKILESWRESGESLNLMVVGYPINMDVILDDYTAKATGGFGDWEYDLSFLEDREIKIKTTTVQAVSTTTRPAVSADTYTVKVGDCLWSIAQQSQIYGKGSRWKEIYNANKEIIDSTAERRFKAAGIDRGSLNGHYIFAGTVLTIPR